MRSFFTVFLFVLIAVIFAKGYPSDSFDEIVEEIQERDAINPFDADAAEQHFIRQKRATCDLLSGFGVGDSVCAARCIAMNRGFRGGWCNKGVCNCRR